LQHHPATGDVEPVADTGRTEVSHHPREANAKMSQPSLRDTDCRFIDVHAYHLAAVTYERAYDAGDLPHSATHVKDAHPSTYARRAQHTLCRGAEKHPLLDEPVVLLL
jgi:hypothetical protein